MKGSNLNVKFAVQSLLARVISIDTWIQIMLEQLTSAMNVTLKPHIDMT